MEEQAIQLFKICVTRQEKMDFRQARTIWFLNHFPRPMRQLEDPHLESKGNRNAQLSLISSKFSIEWSEKSKKSFRVCYRWAQQIERITDWNLVDPKVNLQIDRWAQVFLKEYIKRVYNRKLSSSKKVQQRKDIKQQPMMNLWTLIRPPCRASQSLLPLEFKVKIWLQSLHKNRLFKQIEHWKRGHKIRVKCRSGNLRGVFQLSNPTNWLPLWIDRPQVRLKPSEEVHYRCKTVIWVTVRRLII